MLQSLVNDYPSVVILAAWSFQALVFACSRHSAGVDTNPLLLFGFGLLLSIIATPATLVFTLIGMLVGSYLLSVPWIPVWIVGNVFGDVSLFAPAHHVQAHLRWYVTFSFIILTLCVWTER